MKLILSLILSFSIFSLSAQESWNLEQCIAYALENNIQVQQSKLNLQFNEINKQQSFGAFLPSLNGNATHGYNFGQTIDQFTNQFATERVRSNQFQIATGLTLFNGFQNLNTYKQSQIDFEAGEADLEKMQNDIALNVANAYLNVLFNVEFQKIAEFNVQNSQAQVDRVQKLVDVGQVPEGNLFEIQAQLASDEASLVSTENNVGLAYLSLKQILQLPSDISNGFSVVSPDLGNVEGQTLPPTAEVAANNAITNFPEVRSAQKSLESAEIGLNVAKGGVSPRLTMSYAYGTGYSGFGTVPQGAPIIDGTTPIGFVEGTNEVVSTFDFYFEDFEPVPFGDQLEANVNQSLFFQLNIPIFNGFLTKSNIERAEVNLETAKYNVALVEQTLLQNVETAFADAKAAQNSFVASQKALEASQKAYDYAKVRYEAGVINTVEFGEARVRLDSAKASLVQSKFDFVFKVKVLEFYQGKALSLR